MKPKRMFCDFHILTQIRWILIFDIRLNRHCLLKSESISGYFVIDHNKPKDYSFTHILSSRSNGERKRFIQRLPTVKK